MAKVSQIKLPDGTLFDINDASKVNEESIFSSDNANAYGYIYNRPGEVEGVGIYYSNIQDPLTSETEASVGGISVSYSNMTMGIENQNHWSTISMLADSRDNSVSIGCGYLSDDTPIVNTIIVDPTSTQITNLVYPNNDSDAASKEYVDDEVATKADIATTLSGYGITDASISDRTITLGSNTITVPENMVILSYGHSTWNDFINVYNTNRVVYCRASSNANPASGSQTRLAFMAYVNNADSPTNVEFQYYRSVNSHSASQQGDQVYVYKLESANGGKWTVTVRESYTKIVAGTNMTSSYSSGVLTLNATQPDISGKADIASTLAGYGIEDAYISNGTITLGSDTITPLTSFTESDPIFVASAAYGISSSDITTWNGKQSPATTLSGYGITDAKIENGTITLGSNSITPLTSFTETDPTVPSWAKESTKPTYTASEVGAIASSLKGASNGVAELDANGLVPTSQLPSYVDDVLEYATKSSFPATGETGKIYVDISTNLTYRWSGSAYVEISPSLALGTTSSTAFRGDYGQSAYSHATDSSRLTTATASGLYKIASTAEGHIASLTAVTASDIPDLSSIYLTSETYTGTVTSVRVQATSPVQSSTSTAQSTTLDTTISLIDAYGDTKNPYGTKTANYVLAGPSSGNASAPTFRALVANDIPDLSGLYVPITSTDNSITATITNGNGIISCTTLNSSNEGIGTLQVSDEFMLGLSAPTIDASLLPIIEVYGGIDDNTAYSNCTLYAFNEYYDSTNDEDYNQTFDANLRCDEFNMTYASFSDSDDYSYQCYPLHILTSNDSDGFKYTLQTIPSTFNSDNTPTHLSYIKMNDGQIILSGERYVSSGGNRGGDTKSSSATQIEQEVGISITHPSGEIGGDIPIVVKGVSSNTKMSVLGSINLFAGNALDNTNNSLFMTPTSTTLTMDFDDGVVENSKSSNSCSIFEASLNNGEVEVYLSYLTTPTNDSDAANKKYVDDAISGIDLSDYIASDEIGKVYVSDTEPSNTSNYDIWIDTSTTLQNANGVMV